MANIRFPYGNETLEFEIADRCIGTIVSPRSLANASKPEDLVMDALRHPIGTSALSRLVRPCQKVAVIVDDVSRETPAYLILPHVMNQLHEGGVKHEDIRIVFALGTHRPMTPAEIASKIGEEAARTYSIVNVPCTDDTQLKYMGTSSSGIPAFVNRTVAEADIRISIGMVSPHMDAGFSGGAKIILPGVCGERTVEAFHSREAELGGNQLGLEDAPLRLDLETLVRERVGLDFIFNAVIDNEGALYRCVAGHFIQAHRAGVAIAREVFGTPCPRRYPVVVSNAFPNDIDLWQSTKGLASGELMTEDGGTLILVTRCPEGNETHPLYPGYIGSDPDDLVRRLRENRAEDRVACGSALPICRVRERVKVAVVSPGMDKEIVTRMRFVYYDTIEAALSEELARCGHTDGCVGVLTHGGVSLPIMGKAAVSSGPVPPAGGASQGAEPGPGPE